MASMASAADVFAADPMSLTGLAEAVELDPEIATALWLHLKLNPSRDAEVAANIPDDARKASISAFVEAHDVAPGDSGRISMIFAKLERHRLAVDNPTPPVSEPSVLAPVASAERGKTSAVLDQHDDTSFELLSDDKRSELRKNHFMMTGGGRPRWQGALLRAARSHAVSAGEG